MQAVPCQIHRHINFPLDNEQRPVGDRITDDGFATVNAPHVVALVRADAVFDTGTLVEGPDESGGDQRVA